MAAAVQVTSQTFQALVDKGGIILLDWWAPWCGPCRSFGPVFEKAADAHPDITFGKINTDEERELSGMFEIRSIPTLMVFREKVLIFAQPGAVPAAGLDEIIRQARSLDMGKVRKDLAEQEAAQKSKVPQA